MCSGVERTEKTGEKEEPETRRKKSLLEQIGRKDEEEEELEEEFQVPQQENEGVFSLNKCILAALILLGLGTIFFSGENHLGGCCHGISGNKKKRS